MLNSEPDTCASHPGNTVEFWHSAKKSLGCGRCLLDSGEPLGSWTLIEEALPNESSTLASHLEQTLASKPDNLEYLTDILEGLPEDAMSTTDRAEYLKMLAAAREVAGRMTTTSKALRQLSTALCDA